MPSASKIVVSWWLLLSFSKTYNASLQPGKDALADLAGTTAFSHRSDFKTFLQPGKVLLLADPGLYCSNKLTIFGKNNIRKK